VTDRTISVRAQWALHGKALDDEGYRVIACSNADLSKANFTEVLSRFALGALDKLPQVSVSYLQPATRVSGNGYLALAIHWSAGSGKRYAEGVDRVDNHGRPTTFTSYFAAPYTSLAPYGINYLDMYKAFGAVTLPVKDGPPREVPITPPTRRVPAVDDLAVRVAPLLLTGTPVCVLDADETSLDERLRFIDTVMGLLPYGYRAKMAAATWTRSTNRNHRFRLFFSSEPRAGEKPDHVVSWGAPEQVEIPSRAALAYYRWLSDKVNPLASLTQLNGEATFGEFADSQALKMVDGLRLWRMERSTAPRSPARALPQAQAPAPAQAAPAANRADPLTRILAECAEHVRILNLTRVREDVKLLEDRMRSDRITDDLRKRYRVLIGQYGLLKPNPGLQRKEGALYEALLTLAFGEPLTYEGLCQVEDCLGTERDEAIHKPLLEAIVQVGLGDLRTRVLVQSDLDPKKLPKVLSTRDSDARALIREVAQGSWHRRRHGRVMCDVMLRYLHEKRGKYATWDIQHELFHNGYLAQALRDIGGDQYQVHAITKLLVAAFPADKYPNGLDPAVIIRILAGTPDAPTPALLAAILRKVPATEATTAWAAYVHGSMAKMNLDAETHGELSARLPSIEPEPAQETIQVSPPELLPSPERPMDPLTTETQPMEPMELHSDPADPLWRDQQQVAWYRQMQGHILWPQRHEQQQGPGFQPGPGAHPESEPDLDPPSWANPARDYWDSR
jgi:hypothetical protein